MKPMYPRLSRTWTPYARRFIASALCCAFWSAVFLGAAPARAEDDPQLAAILRQLQAINSLLGQMTDPEFSVVYSYPVYFDNDGFEDLGQRMAQGFDDVAAVLNNSHDGVDLNLEEIIVYLRSIDSNTDIDLKLADILGEIQSMASYIDAVQGHLNNIDYSTSSALYGSGMWGAHLDDAQMAELRLKLDELLQASDQGFDLLNTASGETRLEVKEALDRQYESLSRMIDYLNDLTEPVRTAASNTTDQVVLAEKSLDELERVSSGMRGITNAIQVGPTATALTDGSDATDHLYSPTNHAALDKLKIDQPEIGGIERLTSAIDAADFDVAPSFTGADATITMLRSGTAGLDRDVVVDLALPANVERGISVFAVWLWRILFVSSVWYLVKEEYGYWSTLGGSN